MATQDNLFISSLTDRTTGKCFTIVEAYDLINSGGGLDPTFTTLTEGQVPKANDLGKLIYAGATVDADNVWTFDNSIIVPPSSVVIGGLSLTEAGSYLELQSAIEDTQAFVLERPYTNLGGSSTPIVPKLEAETALGTQPLSDDEAVRTSGSQAIFSSPAGRDAYLTKVEIKIKGPVSDLRTEVRTGSHTGPLVATIGPINITQGAGDVTTLDAVYNNRLHAEESLIYYITETADADWTVLGHDFGGGTGFIPYFQNYGLNVLQTDTILLGQSSQQTGLLEGGIISQASATTVDWTSGRGQVTDYADPEDPDIVEVIWDAVAGATPTNLATDGITVFGYDENGDLVEKLLTAITIEDAHHTIWFGSVSHISSTIISIIEAPGNLAYAGLDSYTSFVNLIIGPANVDGNVYGANGVNMNIDVIGGSAFMMASNFRNDPTLADIITLASEAPVSFSKIYRSADPGLSVIYDGAATTTIDPTQYDDGSGTLQSVTAGYWTIQRIFRSRTGQTSVAYGQEEFVDKAAALAALGSEPFEEKSPLPFSVFRCSLVVSQAATDLSDIAEAEFFTQSSFRLVGAQSASSTIPGVTNPGGIDSAIQFNDGGVFGGDSNFLYDSTLKTMVIEAPAAGSATIEFANSSEVVKGIIKYAETADEFSITATGATSELYLNEVVTIHRGAVDGRIDIKADTATGSGLLTLSTAAGGTVLSLEADDATDSSNITAEIGDLLIATDEADSDINISPDGGVGIRHWPAANYALDVFAVKSEIVGLYSTKGVVLEVGAYGDSESTNFIFNKDDVGIDQSEFVMYNNNHSTESTRYFRMGYADEIATQGGLNISDANNFVGIGTRTDPDSPLHVYQDDTETGDQCGITIEQDGTGDAVLQYLLSGGQRWVTGISNAGGDAFEIASSINLGSDTRLIINTTGEVKITDSLMVGSTSNPVSPLHVYQDDTETGAAAGITIEQDGTADAVLHYVLTGIQTVSTGTDYSGSGHYKISGSADLGTDTILTATLAGRVGIGSDSPASTLHVYDDNTFTGSTIGLTIEQDGTGDALAQWHLTGGTRYLAGIDNSDSDLFKIENGGIFSTAAAIQVNTDNEVGIGIAPDSKLHVYQSDNETGDQAGLTIEQGGTGDAIAQFLLTGGQRWVMGLSNAGGDAFEIASSINLGSNTRFLINTTGEAKIPVSLMVGSTTNPVSKFHVYQDDAVTGTGGGITIEQDGGGDAMLQYLLTAGERYVTGIDNDDSDIFKIESGASLSIAAAIQVNTDNEVGFGGTPLAGFIANVEGRLVVQDHTEMTSTNTPYGGRGQVQNRLQYSQELDNAVWTPGSTDEPVVTANNAIAPDGTMTADTLSFPGPGAGLIRQGTLGLIEDDTYNVSGWVRHVSGGTQLTARLDTDNTDPWITDSRWQRFSSDIVQGSGGPWFDLFVFAAHAPAVFEVWGLQVSDGAGDKPYLKTEELALLTQTQGATVNTDLYVSDNIYKDTHEVATNGPEVVEVWSLDDMPRVGGTGDVIPEYKLYRFMQGIDWGTTRLKLENDAYALFEGADVFVTSQTYSGTDPWIYGDGTIRCVGNGMTWQINSDNATMFDITAGGWGMDYSSLIATGDNCSLGTIVSPAVTDPLLGARFISTRSLFQGYKTGLTLVQPGNIHIDISFFYDATDAVGPMLSVIGMGKAGVIEATEVTMVSASSSFLYVSPITESPVSCLNVTLADEQVFFETGTTGAITLFADASVPAEAVTSVTDNAGTARFNFAAPPTLYVGQTIVMSAFTNYDNVTATITATGAGYFETGVDYNGADTGSFLSDSVTVTSATHGLSELDAVLITETMEYNYGSAIYNVQTNTYQVNLEWHTAETSGTWNDGSLDHTSKYVNCFNNGTQQDSNPAPSFNVADNTETTTTTTSWGAVVFGLTGSALVAGNTNQNFTLLDDVSGLIRYEGIDPLTIKMNPSISMVKSGGSTEHQFRLFKTTGTPAFDPHTVKRSISTLTGAASLNCSAFLNPGDEFRLEVKATTTGSTITITDFSL